MKFEIKAVSIELVSRMASVMMTGDQGRANLMVNLPFSPPAGASAEQLDPLARAAAREALEAALAAL